MRFIAATLLFLLMTKSGSAHQQSAALAAQSDSWNWDPWLVVPMCVALVCFLIGTWRLWQRAGVGRGIGQWQATCFMAGWFALALALVSPLHSIAERMLTAHMIEHELIIALAAPLIVLSHPLAAFIWSIPKVSRCWLGTMARFSPVVFVWLILTDASLATALHVGTVFAWHMPVLFEAALTSPALHISQHVSFLITALLYWWAVLRLPRRKHGVAALHCFVTMMALSLLGALLTLSPHLWYAAYSSPFRFTPLEDQQLAGLVMWVPGCAIYAVAALCFMASWISSTAVEAGSHTNLFRLEIVNPHLDKGRIA